VATIAFVYWLSHDLRFAVERMVSVLVAACPHALGIGVPLAAVVTSLRGARKGILIRNRRAFEQAINANVVVFDKTGTLTKGKLAVRRVLLFGGLKAGYVVKLAASIESLSEHPIGQAIVEYAKDMGIELEKCTDFQVISGIGVRGLVNGIEVFAGGPALLKYLGLTPPTPEPVDGTVVYIIANKRLVGGIVLDDVVREESFEAVSELKRLGLKVAMLTGDSKGVAEKISKELGVNEFFAELTPEDKVEVIEELQSKGDVVIMVGDGINDAPALVKANVGVAIGAGTQVAIESADVVLVRSDPRDVIDVLTLSREMRRKMILNVAWTLAYNSVVMVLAAGLLSGLGLLLTPTLGAITMALSDVVVITISIR